MSVHSVVCDKLFPFIILTKSFKKTKSENFAVLLKIIIKEQNVFCFINENFQQSIRHPRWASLHIFLSLSFCLLSCGKR